MPNPTAYDTDFYLWTQQQAELLAGLNSQSGGIPPNSASSTPPIAA